MDYEVDEGEDVVPETGHRKASSMTSVRCRNK